MSKPYDFGKAAENRAAQFLQEKGYTVLTRNFRYLKAEIDLIARKENTLSIVEVKARTSSYFGAPESFVSKKKMNLLIQAADYYVQNRNLDVDVRFDIIAILFHMGKWKIKHIKGAFYPFA
jgi:putative endonuclease